VIVNIVRVSGSLLAFHSNIITILRVSTAFLIYASLTPAGGHSTNVIKNQKISPKSPLYNRHGNCKVHTTCAHARQVTA